MPNDLAHQRDRSKLQVQPVLGASDLIAHLAMNTTASMVVEPCRDIQFLVR